MLSPEIIQIIKFGIVGVWNTVFSLSLFWLFFKTLQSGVPKNKQNSLPLKIETLSQAGSFVITNIVSYYLNSHFTFEKSDNSRSSFILYIVVSLISLVISSGIMQYFTNQKYFQRALALTSKKIKHYQLTYNHFVFAVNIVSIIAVMIINYLGYKYIVF